MSGLGHGNCEFVKVTNLVEVGVTVLEGTLNLLLDLGRCSLTQRYKRKLTVRVPNMVVLCLVTVTTTVLVAL